MTRLEAVANYHCKVGENPLWNEREGRLYWADIETGRLFRADHVGGKHECFYRSSDLIGGFSFQADESLLLFEVDRIGVLSKAGEYRALLQGIDSNMVRFNDVIADPEGRVFAGTIGKNAEVGGLFRVELDGRVELLWRGTGCANGMGRCRARRGARHVPGDSRFIGHVRRPRVERAVRYHGRRQRRRRRVDPGRDTVPLRCRCSGNGAVPLPDSTLGAHSAAGAGAAGGTRRGVLGSGLPAHHALSRSMLNGLEYANRNINDRA
jgi:hypothetical protein